MKTLSRIALLLLIVPLSLFARIESHEFDNPAQEALYVQLTKELRCLVCQNQNLADSNAELAKDLREKAYEMVKQGKTHDQITEYMIARYGDFVMYRPPMKTSTYLLWLGPFVFLLIALLVLIFFIRKKSSSNDAPTDDELKAARQHLDI
jgi:cytochrome c-type biogenesis protein CcmH